VSRNAVRERKKPAVRSSGNTKAGKAAQDEFFQKVVQWDAEAKEDASYDRPQSVPKLTPKTNNQAIAQEYLREGRSIVVLAGSAGTGKSMLAAHHAAQQLAGKRVTKVCLVRPAVAVGKSVGMLPGDIREKLAPYFKQTIAHFQKFLGEGALRYHQRKGNIEMLPVEYLRGMSFEDCIVICEEVQNFTAEEMQMMLTRLGDNCQLVFTGDQRQHDLKGTSGLEQMVKLLDHVRATHPAYLDKTDIEHLTEDIGIVHFTPEDVVRSGLTKAFVKVFFYND
jgi:phosphate starvation-inducible PhoH-like protein